VNPGGCSLEIIAVFCNRIFDFKITKIYRF